MSGTTPKPLAVFNAGPFHADKSDGLYHYVGGDNPTLFARMMEIDPAHVVEVPVQDADCRFPDPSEIAGVVISGSPAMITDRHAWAERAAQWIADNNGKVPVLGVCFGHQLVAHALGGRVAALPDRSEYGTIEVEATAAADSDTLFQGVPSAFKAQAAHSQTVADLPRGATLLAHNGFGVQAARMSETVWGTQFHPEFDLGFMRVLFQNYATYMGKIGVDVDAEHARLAQSPMALRVLRNFAALVKPRIV